MKLPDIDIDVKDRKHALKGLQYREASLFEGGELRKHNTGLFFQDIPIDPISGLASLPSNKKFDFAAANGFFKMDILTNSAYELVQDPDHLDEVLKEEVDWSLFLDREIVEQLHQLGNSYDIIFAYEPKSIEELACLIALIRPGKRHLLGEEWDVVKREVWKPDETGYYYKKSHAIAFAMSIIVQLNLLRSLTDKEKPCRPK